MLHSKHIVGFSNTSGLLHFLSHYKEILFLHSFQIYIESLPIRKAFHSSSIALLFKMYILLMVIIQCRNHFEIFLFSVMLDHIAVLVAQSCLTL